MLNLNLGGGVEPLPGFINIDVKSNPPGIVYPLEDYEDETVDCIRASHILEHFSHSKVEKVLTEWVRVLKPGGLLKISVPDFKKIAEIYVNGEQGNIQGWVMGGHKDQYDHHGSLFDSKALVQLFHAVGLIGIRPWTSEVTDCASYPISLNLCARKPVTVTGVKIVMSMPRLGFTANQACLMQALSKHSLEVEIVTGAFWGKCLAKAIGQNLDCDYVLTVDYDSVFTHEDISELYRIVYQNNDIDALFPMQMKREGHGPLFTTKSMEGAGEVTFGTELTRDEVLDCESGHFGLTLLKTEPFRRLPHPWFYTEPDGNPQWEDGTVDEDIVFWRNWKKNGFTLYQANRVVIGHCEQVVTWPGGNLSPIVQSVGNYLTTGKPNEVWT